MTDNAIIDLHRRHTEAQNKYAYFLLAVTASIVAFAIQKTDGMVLSNSMIPLGIAMLCWIGSFYCGCQHLVWFQTVLRANYGLLQVREGVHPKQPINQEHKEAAILGIKDAIESNLDATEAYAISQFRLLVLGTAFFLIWYVFEMWLRTVATSIIT